MHYNYRACVIEPKSHNYWAYKPQLLKPKCSGVHAPQQEMPAQWEAYLPQLESGPCLLQLEENLHNNEDPA